MDRAESFDAAQSFDAYVRARTPALTRVAYLLTGDHHLAEDLVQQALLRVVPRWKRILEGGDPDAYVRRTLYHLHVSWWRRTRREIVAPARTAPARAEPTGADPADAVTMSVAVRRALAQLPPRQRAVIVLRYYEDLTETQAAQLLGIAVGTVKSQTRDALERLRRLAPALGSELGLSAPGRPSTPDRAGMEVGP